MMNVNKKYLQKKIDHTALCEIIKPGNRIFISSGPMTPLETITYILNTAHSNFRDLEIIQLNIPDEVMNIEEASNTTFRMKTFKVGETITKARSTGNIDFVPTTIAEIAYLFLSGAVGIDVAIVQTSSPDKNGNLNMGVVNDIADIIVKKVPLLIVEANCNVPRCTGQTTLSIDHVSYVVESEHPLIEYPVKSYDETMDKIGWNVASMIENGTAISLNYGRMYNAIVPHLKIKKDLKVWSHAISDWIIDLIESGAINEKKFGRDCPVVTTSCIGTSRLYSYVSENKNIKFVPLLNTTYQIEMQRIQKLVCVLDARKIDISCDLIQLSPNDLQLAGFDSKLNFAIAASHSRDGKVIIAVKSTDPEGKSNIVISHNEKLEYVRSTLGTPRYVVTEFGIANIFGKTIRERTLAMIDIAHPNHRKDLLEEAKAAGILYPDQIYIIDNMLNYPYNLKKLVAFKNNLEVKFRPISPSDEDMMRRLFYNVSDKSKYLRYFSSIRTMTHAKMQSYVNIDYKSTLSIVGIIQERGIERIIAECRYALSPEKNTSEMAFIVDDEFHNRGIASYMLNMLLETAKERGIPKLTAYVLPGNNEMMMVFENARITPSYSDEGDEIKYTFFLLN